MRFNFERGAKAVADIDDARIFAGALHDLRAFGGQAAQMNAAGFVGAMLAPHHAENSEFGDIRIAAENFLNARVFFGGKAVLGGDCLR